jgi:predicted O-methyltransferase YrrM
MANTLASARVQGVLRRLYAQADAKDDDILARIKKEADTKYEGQRYVPELAPLFDSAVLPVPPAVGQFLYLLTRTKRPETIVEIGTSFGVSAIHFASALHDNGEGRLTTVELSATKAKLARGNLEEAGLAHLADIRNEDAFSALKDFQFKIDVLFLDGWKDFYLPLLHLLEPMLASSALVIADDTKLFPDRLAGYLDYVHDLKTGYHSVDIPLGDGLEVSLRT